MAFTELQGSINLASADYQEQIRLGIQGAFKSGKTTAGVSFPNPVIASTDRGEGGHKGENIIVIPFYDPKFCDKYAKRTSPANPKCPPNKKDALLMWLLSDATKLEKDQTLVLDNNTGIEQAFHTQWWTAPIYTKQTQEVNSFAEYREKITYYTEIVSALKALTCDVVYIFHESPERNKDGYVIGVKPLMSGQFADQIGSHCTDWVRALTVRKPSSDKKEEFKKHYQLDETRFKEWMESNTSDTIFIWETQAGEDVKCGMSTLKGVPRYVLAGYNTFKKYGNRK